MFLKIVQFIIACLLMLLIVTACNGVANQAESMQTQNQNVENGDVDEGRELLRRYGCGACHTIPGIPGAHTHVGPPLTDWSQRQFIAGSVPNTTDNLIDWIINPHSLEPDTAMPVLGVNEEDARHISAYLYTLGR